MTGEIKLNKIYNMDCIEGMKLIDNDSVHLVVTSPPYFNAKKYIEYDSVDSYIDIMRKCFSSCFRVLKPSRMCIINISPILVSREKRSEQSHRIPLPFYIVPMMEELGFEFLEDIIWKKPKGSVPNRNGEFYKHRKPVAYKPNVVTEYILVFKKYADFLIDDVLKDDSLVKGNYDKTNIWEFNPEISVVGHPAPFPLDLPMKCIRYYSYEKDLILDPFMGSGTTAVACRRLKRNFIGFEINPDYAKVANERLKMICDIDDWI